MSVFGAKKQINVFSRKLYYVLSVLAQIVFDMAFGKIGAAMGDRELVIPRVSPSLILLSGLGLFS